MTKAKAPVPRPGRYDWLTIARRVERERTRRAPPGERSPLERKELADRIRMDPQVYQKKAGGTAPRTPFTVEELGRIADVLHAPPLWPFDEWDTLEHLFRGRS